MAKKVGLRRWEDGLKRKVSEENGAALAIALMILVVLAFIGSAAIMTTTTEVEIAGNQKQYKMAFYEADGGTEAGTEVLEESIYQRGLTLGQYPDFTIPDPRFYLNSDLGQSEKPSGTNRDVSFDGLAGTGDTNLLIGGSTQLSSGGAIQLMAGYEGKGKGASGGGAWVVYDVRSEHRNVTNSEAVVNLRWRHVM